MRRFLIPFLFAAAPALAHDFWIEPSDFHPVKGSSVAFALRAGESFRGEPVVRDEAFVASFVAIDDAGTRPVTGTDGADPAGSLVIRSAATVVVYRGRPRFIKLDAERFEAYLREEGLEAIVLERRRRGESHLPGREIYSRCAKALLGPVRPNRAGLDLELIAEPLASGAQFRLEYGGSPLAGSLVVAIHRDDPSARLSARTDREGRVRLPLTRSGVWLVKSVHMIRAPAASGADWESLWASLTFEKR
ncbi:MAG TPA: DUF4198 domain-containing protein [Thermoanaerobaculia bacterium]|nr:DUF4198 domain-containing protein [Thermoanaerobaculia bacterium]